MHDGASVAVRGRSLNTGLHTEWGVVRVQVRECLHGDYSALETTLSAVVALAEGFASWLNISSNYYRRATSTYVTLFPCLRKSKPEK